MSSSLPYYFFPYLYNVITEAVALNFQRMPGRVTIFGQKNRKPASMMTLFYIDKVITDPVMNFFLTMPGKVTTLGQKNIKHASVMTLFYIAKVIADPDFEFPSRGCLEKIQLLVRKIGSLRQW